MSTIKTIVCNKCRRSKIDDGSYKVHREYHEVIFTFITSEDESNGYRFDLCDECVNELLESLEVEAEHWESGM